MKKPTTRSGTGAAGAQGKASAKAESKRVWRISDRAPLGEWVDPSIPVQSQAPEAAAADPATSADAHGSWLESSMDLLRGVDVRHGDDTLPGELFGDFSPTRPQRD